MYIWFDRQVDMFDFDFEFDGGKLRYVEYSDEYYEYDYLAYDNSDGSQVRLSGGILAKDSGGYYGEIGFVSYYDKDNNRILSIDLYQEEDLEQFVFQFGSSFSDYLNRHGDERIGIVGSDENDILLIPYGHDGVLQGGPGNDEHWGGEGETVFFFRRKFGKDIIHDYQPGDDLIDLTHFFSNNNRNYWRKMKNDWSKTKDGDTILKLGENCKLTLVDVKFSELGERDFYFF